MLDMFTFCELEDKSLEDMYDDMGELKAAKWVRNMNI